MTCGVRSALLAALATLSGMAGCGVDETVLRELPATVLPVDGGVDAPIDSGVFPENTSDVFDVALGQYHSCALLRGIPFCWGSNVQGALGTGSGQDRPSPTPVVGGLVFDVLSGGENHTCGLERESGRVFCWGGASHGQLGQGDKTTWYVPVAVPLPNAARVMSVGYNHSCAILQTGELYCWGINEEGQLGQNDVPGSNTELLSPTRVGNAADWIAVAGGQGHTCGLRQSSGGGTLWCWGRNSDSQLGLGPGLPTQIHVPTQVGTQDDWKSIDLGQDVACGIAADASLRCWGRGGDARLDGTGNSIGAPTTIGSDRDWSKVSIDAFDTCGITSQSQLRCWGRNEEGQLGLGDNTSRPAPTPVPGAWSSVSVGRFHVCAMRTDHTITCTGANDSGQLGVGDTQYRNVFTPVQAPPSGPR